MAATRYTAPAGLIQRGRKAAVCPTCGKARMLHGHRGALQRPFSCGQQCYQQYRQFGLAREFASQGLAYAVGVSPITPGGVSR